MSEYPVEIDGGLRVAENEHFYIDVIETMFNWRLVASLKHGIGTYERGYCYIGKTPQQLLLASLAGRLWAQGDVLNDDPIGWDKDAFRQRYSDAYLARERENRPGESLVPNDQLSGHS